MFKKVQFFIIVFILSVSTIHADEPIISLGYSQNNKLLNEDTEVFELSDYYKYNIFYIRYKHNIYNWFSYKTELKIKNNLYENYDNRTYFYNYNSLKFNITDKIDFDIFFNAVLCEYVNDFNSNYRKIYPAVSLKYKFKISSYLYFKYYYYQFFNYFNITKYITNKIYSCFKYRFDALTLKINSTIYLTEYLIENEGKFQYNFGFQITYDFNKM